MSVISKFKSWVKKTFGGGSSKSSGRSSSRSSASSRKTTRASRVSNYGGGGSRSYRDYSSGSYSADYQDRQSAELRRRQEQARRRQATTEAFASISKRTDALSTGRSPSAANSATSAGNGYKVALKKIEQKAKSAPPDPKIAAKEASKNRATKMLKSIEADRKSYNKATGNKYNTEVGTKEERQRARQRIKAGEYQSDPNAEKWEVKHHPIAASASRGALSGTTLGASELIAQKSKKRQETGAEQYYQANKNKWAEMGGEAVGSLATFGATAGLTERAGAKIASKVAPNAAERLAERKLIQKAAQKSVDKAVKKGLIKEGSEELVKRVGKEKAAKIVNALGNDIVQNLTTGAAYDINKASAEYEIGSSEWWKELGKSAAFNAVITGGVAGGSMLTGGKRIVREVAGNMASEGAMRNLVADAAEKTARKETEYDKLLKAQEERNAFFGRHSREAEDVARATEPPKPRVEPRDTEPPRPQGADNTAKADALRQRQRELQEEWSKFERGESKLTPYEIEEMGDELDDIEQQLQTLGNADKARPQNAEKITPPPVNTAGEITDNAVKKAETPPPRAEATAAPNAEPPRKITAEDVRKAQTKEESQKLMQAYFDENGEADLGIYGQITKNADGTYKIVVNGADGEVTLTKAEAEKRISDSIKRAYAEPDVIDDVGEVVYKRKERASNREKIEKAAKSFKRLIFNSLDEFERVERQQAKAAGRAVDHGATDFVRRHQAMASNSIGNAQLKFDGKRYAGTVKRIGADGVEYEIENGKSLKDIYMGMDEKTEEAFDAYLTLRHAPDRLREGKPVFDNKEFRDGRNLNDPNVCREEADRILKEHPEFAKKAEEVYQFTQNELKNRVDAGLLKQSVVDDWNKKYPYYVPTGREGFNEIHGMHGPIVGAEELKAAKGSGRNINSIRDQLSMSTTRNWRDMTTNYLFRQTFGDRIAADLAKQPDGGIETVLDNTINLGKDKSGKYFATVFDKEGNKHTIDLEEGFYEDLKDLYKNGRIGIAAIDVTNDAFAKVATKWKALITEMSPIFLVKNGMRDFPEAIINSKQTKEFLGSMGEAWRDLINGGEYSKALRDAGISQSMFINLDEAITKGAKEGKGIFGKLAKANELMEMYPRLCEYMATFKKAGVSLEDADMALRMRAAANAADVTVNFGRSGSIGKLLNRGFVPFFNPSAQGWSKFVRNLTEQPGAKEWLGFLTKATALGAGATTINNFLLSDNPNYQQISARDKATNYIIPWPPMSDNTDTFIKIPASRFAAVYSLPAVNLMNDNKMGWAEMLKVANDQVAPIDPLESTLLSPFIAAKNNKTWYGSPIVPGALEDLPKSEQYDANTSYLGRALGKATENLPKEFQISPKKADYIIDAETGVIGDFMLPALTPSKQGGGNAFERFVAHPMGNVAKKAFTIDSTTQNDLSSRFYEKLQDATTNSKSAKATDADAEEYKRLSAYSTENSKIAKAITELQNSNKPTKQEDIRGLQKVRNQLLQDALDGKETPGQAKTMDAVQKYVGTTYAINNFGSSADQEAMKVYGLSKYGNMTEDAMRKKIDSDTSFYNGVQAIGHLEDKLSAGGAGRTTTTLAKAVALADAGADEDLFGAYKCTKKSRTETVNKMERAKTYLSSGGSVDEYVKLEKARKSLGKLSDYDKESELDKINDQLAKGQISDDEYYTKQGEIVYNANISYVGLATSLAQSNAPARGYKLYDIKDKNIQKGINLAAMGFTARDYREMAKAVDADGNGYPKKQEIIDYVANSDVADKATLYDALYYYKSSRNPFGTPTNYSRDQAAAAGKAKGVDPISDERGDLDLTDDEESKKSGYGYRRRRYGRRWRHYGHGGSSKKATVPTPKAIKASQFTQGTALGRTTKSSSTTKSSAKATPPTLKRVEAKIDLPTVKTTTKKR